MVRLVHKVARLGRTLRSWRAQVLAHFDTAGLSNGGTEAINLIIEKRRRLAHGHATSPTTDCACSSPLAERDPNPTDDPTTLKSEEPLRLVPFSRVCRETRLQSLCCRVCCAGEEEQCGPRSDCRCWNKCPLLPVLLIARPKPRVGPAQARQAAETIQLLAEKLAPEDNRSYRRFVSTLTISMLLVALAAGSGWMALSLLSQHTAVVEDFGGVQLGTSITKTDSDDNRLLIETQQPYIEGSFDASFGSVTYDLWFPRSHSNREFALMTSGAAVLRDPNSEMTDLKVKEARCLIAVGPGRLPSNIRPDTGIRRPRPWILAQL